MELYTLNFDVRVYNRKSVTVSYAGVSRKILYATTRNRLAPV